MNRAATLISALALTLLPAPASSSGSQVDCRISDNNVQLEVRLVEDRMGIYVPAVQPGSNITLRVARSPVRPIGKDELTRYWADKGIINLILTTDKHSLIIMTKASSRRDEVRHYAGTYRLTYCRPPASSACFMTGASGAVRCTTAE